jgi:hypothetical protein
LSFWLLEIEGIVTHGCSGHIKVIFPFCRHHPAKTLLRYGDSPKPPTRIIRYIAEVSIVFFCRSNLEK